MVGLFDVKERGGCVLEDSIVGESTAGRVEAASGVEVKLTCTLQASIVAIAMNEIIFLCFIYILSMLYTVQNIPHVSGIFMNKSAEQSVTSCTKIVPWEIDRWQIHIDTKSNIQLAQCLKILPLT